MQTAWGDTAQLPPTLQEPPGTSLHSQSQWSTARTSSASLAGKQQNLYLFLIAWHKDHKQSGGGAVAAEQSEQ